MSVELGSVLVGIAALITALSGSAMYVAHRARRTAAQALRATPMAVAEGLRAKVEEIQKAYQVAIKHHRDERSGMETSLARQRLRAEEAELQSLALLAQVATLQIDLAQARQDIAELRSRFDALQQVSSG